MQDVAKVKVDLPKCLAIVPQMCFLAFVAVWEDIEQNYFPS